MSREESLHAWMSQARWFGGKGRQFSIGEIREHEIAPEVTTNIVEVVYGDDHNDHYQVPLSSYEEPQERIAHALVGEWDGRSHYDAVHDREAMAAWLRAFATGASGTVFHRVTGHELDLSAHSTLFSGEQSNSSVAFGEDSLMKLFRRVAPGANPDIEVHRALTESGSEHVAHLYGWVELPDGPIQLAMLQEFLRTATEGWDFALTSVRNLFAEGDLHPSEVGGDFAAEAHRLGVAVAEVHQTLRERFPTEPLDTTAVSVAMRGRLEAVAAEIPQVAELAAPARAAYDRVAALSDEHGLLAQRIHGDLHLGQTLRSALGWKLVDFEGEPARPLAERTLPDSPWRDVAGMLRSFDYAARTVEGDFDVEPQATAQIDYRASEWVERNRQAFLDGYAEATAPLTQPEQVLIEAYELDKAVYEVAYETHNRPAWVHIPLAALSRAVEQP